MPVQGPSFLVLDLICYGIIKKAMGSYVKILIGRAPLKNLDFSSQNYLLGDSEITVFVYANFCSI